MPRKPTDCSKYVIYKIVCLNADVDYIYVGSTTDFIRRKCSHKSNCNNQKRNSFNYKLYQTIRSNGGWENWKMIKIKDFPCEYKWEATKEEDRIMLELNANLNSNRASRSKQEWHNDNKEKMVEYHKTYYIDNKEKMDKCHKNFYTNNKETLAEKINCECGCIVRRDGHSYHKKTPKHKQLMEQLELQN